MRFNLTDDQKAIRDAARSLLAAAASRRRTLAEQETHEAHAWAQMRALGWPALAVPEADGGLGLGVVELAVLAEELGHALVASPLLPSVMASLLIAHGGDRDQRDRWLAALAAGDALGTVARRQGITAIGPDAKQAAVIVIVEDTAAAELLDAKEAQITALQSIDLTRPYCRIDGQGTPLGHRVVDGLWAAEIAVAAESVGVAARLLEMAVDYARERTQYGRAIGSYQAVSHACAEMYLRVESARSLVYGAAWAADHDAAALPVAAAAAAAHASDSAWRVAAAALQVHGGVGFTWEHDLHLYLRRARANMAWLGGPELHRERVAAATLDTAP